MTSVFLFTESRFSPAVVVLVYKVDIDHQLVDNSYSVDGTYTDMHMCECIYVHIIYTYKGGIYIFKNIFILCDNLVSSEKLMVNFYLFISKRQNQSSETLSILMEDITSIMYIARVPGQFS